MLQGIDSDIRNLVAKKSTVPPFPGEYKLLAFRKSPAEIAVELLGYLQKLTDLFGDRLLVIYFDVGDDVLLEDVIEYRQRVRSSLPVFFYLHNLTSCHSRRPSSRTPTIAWWSWRTFTRAIRSAALQRCLARRSCGLPRCDTSASWSMP